MRWRCAQDEAAVVQALAHIPEAIWEPPQLVLTVGPGPMYLFDAAYPGTERRVPRRGALAGSVYARDRRA